VAIDFPENGEMTVRTAEVLGFAHAPPIKNLPQLSRQATHFSFPTSDLDPA
jgi:hypothetical protein